MEFKFGTNKYRTNTIDAFTQLYIVRRLAPCLGALLGGMPADAEEKINAGDEAVALIPLAKALGQIPDADAEYVINACLEAAERKQSGGGWAGVRVNGTTMFTLNLPEMLCIAVHVFRANMADFMAALPPDTAERAQGKWEELSGSVFRVGKTSS